MVKMRTLRLKYKVIIILAVLAIFLVYMNLSWSERPAAPALKPVKIQTSVTGYEYTASNFRDPFMPLIKRKDDKDKIKGGRASLEEFETVNLNLIAILWDKKEYYAVVRLPDGTAYTIMEGARLGSNKGIVSKITKDAVIIKETVRDLRGMMIAKDTILKLHREDN